VFGHLLPVAFIQVARSGHMTPALLSDRRTEQESDPVDVKEALKVPSSDPVRDRV
jgi:hypothetical protein